jgi:hypothetical protein
MDRRFGRQWKRWTICNTGNTPSLANLLSLTVLAG